jgi:hypothetical protein
MKRHITTLLLMLGCLTAGSELHRLFAAPVTVVHAQTNILSAACTVQVPMSWGPFKDASTSGFVFEDTDHTLRILQNLPCGTSGVPHVDLMIQRSN